MTGTIGICTSSRSERHLMEAIVKECNSGKYDLKAELVELRDSVGRLIETHRAYDFDILIIPADRSEMTKFALDCFHRNIPFCHVFSGSITYSYTHDDINRFLIALMANMCFAESPEAAENLKRVGIPEDRILVTGTSHFDGVTNYDIESNKPKGVPNEPYDLFLINPETITGADHTPWPTKAHIYIQPNEDNQNPNPEYKRYDRLEFLYLLKHCDRFISNSSAIHYEIPYLNKFFGTNIKVFNPSQRNAERTPIDPMYCRGASAKIAEWCEEVDLAWLKIPKRLFSK